MCFSATASYVASAILLLCGIAALSRAKKNQLFFASIPILFSIQQFIEGTIWQSLTQGSSATLAIYAYVCFVAIIWPNWIPYSIYHISNFSEKKKLSISMVAGILTGILSAAYLMAYPPIAIIAENHIRYTSDIPQWLWIPGTFLYLTATVMPFFIPKIPSLSIMGVILAISYVFAFLFYYNYIISIWCFFAAILSVLVILILR